MAAIQIVRIGAERIGEAIDLGIAIGGHEPGFVKPLRQPLEAELAGKSAFGRYGTMELFGVERDGRLVARAAAIVNPRLVDAGGAPLGQVGYFESENDAEVARALFDAVFASLRARGARQAVGPMNGGAHRAHRFMTQGFERAPFLFEPRNPAFYPTLFDAAGFGRVHTWRTFELGPGEVRRFGKIVARASAALPQTAQLELLDPRKPEVLVRLHRLLDRVWKGHVGYAPIDLDELAEVIGGALVLMTDRHFGIVHDGRGTDLGCSFMFPDYVAEVRALHGDASRWGSWLAQATPKTLVMHTHAVVEEARRTNAVSLGLARGVKHFEEDGYERLVVALVTEEWQFFGRHASPTREYALYGTGLA
ncbi:MAG: hypothetical protein ACLQVI_02945 [Polyangiaceae bacterium]